MRKFLLIIFSSSLVTGLSAQSLEGIWISSSRMDLQKITDSTYFQGDTILSKKLEKVEIDTSYYNAYALIHFIDSNELIFHGIGGKNVYGTHSKNLDTVSVELDTVQFKLLKRKDNLILLDLDSGWQNSHLIFEKMLPKSNLTIDLMKLEFESGSYWKVNTDSSSMNFGLELHFLDSSQVMLSQLYDDQHASTSDGEYKTAVYENNLFLYIIDRHSLDDRLFRIYSASTNKLMAQSFEVIWREEPPTKREFEIIKARLPKEKELKRIKESIIGEWFLDGTVLPFDTAFSDYTSFVDQFYKLNFFRDGDFSISYGGIYIKKDERTPRSKEIKGTWELGPTGHYIKLKVKDGYLEYMTIIDLKSDDLLIGMDTEYLDFEMTYSHYPIKLKKGANKR